MKNGYKHKLLLVWLVYLASIISIGMFFGYLGFIQLGFSLDRSYLSLIITGFYIISEIYLGCLIVKTSKELVLSYKIGSFLNKTRNFKFRISNESVVIEDSTGKTIKNIEPSYLSEHIKNLILRSQNWSGKKPRLDQETLLSALGERLFEKNSWASFAATVILLGGLIGTITGILLSFWPFIDTTATAALDLTKIQNDLPKVFSGVGAAFFPSIFAAIYAMFLSFIDRILQGSSIELIGQIANISETHVVPVLEKREE